MREQTKNYAQAKHVKQLQLIFAPVVMIMPIVRLILMIIAIKTMRHVGVLAPMITARTLIQQLVVHINMISHKSNSHPITKHALKI